VEIPFAVEEAFSSKRPKVKATIEGVSYRGTLVRTPALAPGASVGSPNHNLIVLKEIRQKIGKTFGDIEEAKRMRHASAASSRTWRC